MPDARLARTRIGYEDYVYEPPRARGWSLADAQRLYDMLSPPPPRVCGFGVTANVIEGEHFDADAHLGAVDTE